MMDDCSATCSGYGFQAAKRRKRFSNEGGAKENWSLSPFVPASSRSPHAVGEFLRFAPASLLFDLSRPGLLVKCYKLCSLCFANTSRLLSDCLLLIPVSFRPLSIAISQEDSHTTAGRGLGPKAARTPADGGATGCGNSASQIRKGIRSGGGVPALLTARQGGEREQDPQEGCGHSAGQTTSNDCGVRGGEAIQGTG